MEMLCENLSKLMGIKSQIQKSPKNIKWKKHTHTSGYIIINLWKTKDKTEKKKKTLKAARENKNIAIKETTIRLPTSQKKKKKVYGRQKTIEKFQSSTKLTANLALKFPVKISFKYERKTRYFQTKIREFVSSKLHYKEY